MTTDPPAVGSRARTRLRSLSALENAVIDMGQWGGEKVPAA
jgi:hypothetical protein